VEIAPCRTVNFPLPGVDGGGVLLNDFFLKTFLEAFFPASSEWKLSIAQRYRRSKNFC